MGEKDGWSRIWGPDGKLLFEGLAKNGREHDGWFETSMVSSSGVYHREGGTWTIVQWKEGKKVRNSSREVTANWRSWTPGQLPDQKKFIRWNWSQFAGKTEYPFADQMPAYDDVPVLIGWIGKKGGDPYMIDDQLHALTRVDFGNSWMQKEKERADAVAKWRAWWEEVGQHRPGLLEKNGKRDAEAWNLVQRYRKLPAPDQPMLIPEEYVLEAHYSSGDYGAVVSETMEIRRGKDGAELIRKFSRQRDGPVKEERWLPFSAEDADRITRAVGYLVDRPWLLNDEAEIEKLYWEAEKKEPDREAADQTSENRLKGRESFAPPYYPNADYELRDAAGKLWWNSDPDRWHGGNPERFNQTDRPVPGVVYPFLAAQFPESARSDGQGTAGWTDR
ncbi:MAG: hypothetical protein ACKO2G_06070 [Verrucomicrobiales bacterium]